ncbi:MAG: hypothetical protein GF315_10570 [candidate division Zixibacteria bacterium]|nr:hypothetical protein [candidate division Zixibacteria bacterium]
MPSLYYKREPEVIFDTPRRLEPGFPLNIVLIVKDADKFPVTINRINAKIRQVDDSKFVPLSVNPMKISEYLFHRVFPIEESELPYGDFEIVVDADITVNGKNKTVTNDNHQGTSHDAFKIYRAEQPLPKSEGWYAGDIHIHSDATDDFVEFGAPVELYAGLARAIGLDWIAINDHSYDIDDEPGKYYAPDPELKRWQKLTESIKKLKANRECIVIQGEEISCGNKYNRNVHILGLNINKFIPGFGDSAESWLHNSPTSAIPEITDEILRQNGLPVAAHPGEEPLFLEKLLLNRGPWTYQDFRGNNLHHLQILNGRRSDSFYAGIEIWKRLLLDGRRKFIVAGSDAHGNLNRTRQIRLPFISFNETDQQIFGCSRTLVFLGKTHLSVVSVLQAITRGNCVISDGPFIDFHFKNDQGDFKLTGDTVGYLSESNWEPSLVLKSSPEFGKLRKVIVYFGDLSIKEEHILIENSNFPNEYECEFDLNNLRDTLKDLTDIVNESPSGYLRVELITTHGNICMTNPIWVH